MPARPFRVGRSPTGLGLFAVRPIKDREYILTYVGRRIPTPVAHERERRRGLKYMFEINARWTIDGSSRKNLGRYVNHSCRPNAEPLLRRGRIVLIAARAIREGEEITFDYGEEYVELFFKTGCRCAACMAKAARRKSGGVAKQRRRSRSPYGAKRISPRRF